MAKGRKRKAGRREPNGRISRAAAADKVFEVARQQPHRRNLENWRDERAVDEMGRLAIAGKIDGEAYEAGKVWRSVVAAHRRALAAPSPNPRACGADYIAERVGGQAEGVTEIDPRTPEERDRAAGERWERADRVLRDCGYQAAAEVESVVIDDRQARNVPMLQRGLAALAWHFGVSAERRPNEMKSWQAA